MFRYLLGGGGMSNYLVQLLLSLPIVLLSLSVHETAHGFAAYALGDPTARNFGRLTLNPIRHLDPIGFICMLFTGFGWARPVPVNSRNFKKPRRDIALVAMAGPVSNLLLSFLFLLVLRFVGFGVLMQIETTSGFLNNVLLLLTLFFYYGVSLNLTLAIFNLLPIPPLDGSRILFHLLPARIYFKIAPYERTIALVMMVLLLLGPLSYLVSLLTSTILRWMLRLVGLASFF